MHSGIREAYDYSIKSLNSSNELLSSLKAGISATSPKFNPHYFNSVNNSIDIIINYSRIAAENASLIKSAAGNINCPKADSVAIIAELFYLGALSSFAEARIQIKSATESKDSDSSKRFLQEAIKSTLKGIQNLDNGTTEHKKLVMALKECHL